MIKNKKERGFTLLELLVVIGIIGLLAAILVINFTSARRRARDTKRIADVRNLQTAVEDYYGTKNHYPTYISDLVTNGNIPSWPLDPLAPAGTTCTSNGNYCYFYATNSPSGSSFPAQSYHLGASLEDSGNMILNQDKDCNSLTGANCPIATPYFNGFNGSDATGCDGSTGRYCYDIAQ